VCQERRWVETFSREIECVAHAPKFSTACPLGIGAREAERRVCRAAVALAAPLGALIDDENRTSPRAGDSPRGGWPRPASDCRHSLTAELRVTAGRADALLDRIPTQPVGVASLETVSQQRAAPSQRFTDALAVPDRPARGWLTLAGSPLEAATAPAKTELDPPRGTSRGSE
jgi:hypothetical protein